MPSSCSTARPSSRRRCCAAASPPTRTTATSGRASQRTTRARSAGRRSSSSKRWPRTWRSGGGRARRSTRWRRARAARARRGGRSRPALATRHVGENCAPGDLSFRPRYSSAAEPAPISVCSSLAVGETECSATLSLSVDCCASRGRPRNTHSAQADTGQALVAAGRAACARARRPFYFRANTEASKKQNTAPQRRTPPARMDTGRHSAYQACSRRNARRRVRQGRRESMRLESKPRGAYSTTGRAGAGRGRVRRGEGVESSIQPGGRAVLSLRSWALYCPPFMRASKAAVISALRADCAARLASFFRRFSSIIFMTSSKPPSAAGAAALAAAAALSFSLSPASRFACSSFSICVSSHACSSSVGGCSALCCGGCCGTGCWPGGRYGDAPPFMGCW
mmetsp:Transcript_1036/g.3320  ORF Transcript_1036/g.3320 Transcript_1036/m.3320 type:complete len:396 (-) Transcript_1036:179-1366(-)